MHQYHVAITIDDNYIQHACVMLQSLNEHAISPIEVYCISDNLSDGSKNILKNHFKKSKLTISFVGFNPGSLPQLPIKHTDHVSAATFFRIWLPQLLPHVKQVLFLDTDILINNDLSSVFNLNIDNYPIAAVPDLGASIEKKTQLGIHAHKLYFNAGVMLVNLDYFRKHHLTRQLAHFISTKPELCEFWDQDALNAIISGNFLELHPRFNLQSTTYDYKGTKGVDEAIANPAIVHFTGGGSCKPWFYQNQHPLKYLYYQNLKKTPFRFFYPADLPRSWHFLRKLKHLIKYSL
ncbi:glycosyltransferase family 8 protein [Mucilaginibacter terrae]|uniref:Lipopolysaccharide biosynthesis glycosyltransferase n=1 Tax=Mucilaginibacter terrae TaxID=1955052 RepID=A0ABU3H1M9_9SPHI|nr:glycosyltransferase family 8 protein [Mucilaginibacter terrae]MDT3405172.1 lipopolysaccharide biosynthesis glycosyltransferase [Mucilaginibacter terrae]